MLANVRSHTHLTWRLANLVREPPSTSNPRPMGPIVLGSGTAVVDERPGLKTISYWEALATLGSIANVGSTAAEADAISPLQVTVPNSSCKPQSASALAL